MKIVNLDMLAKELSENVDFPFSETEAKAFIKEAWPKVLDIMNNSKGKIMIRHADIAQIYKTIDKDQLKFYIQDLNETKNPKLVLRPYRL